ncbi:MAG: nucleotide exchange factor GrpE [Candidatus Thorarchaeota archaeon]|nr:nucleotide exchange factor GrpE [Candidatus Thorarchaeota archaeon]
MREDERRNGAMREHTSVDTTSGGLHDDLAEIPVVDPLEVEREKNKVLSEQLMRTQADYENFRKRSESRYQEAVRYASEGILLRLLEVHDNLERALESDFADPKAAKEGVRAICQQMTKLLELESVRPIESVGRPFDPYYHHAVAKGNDPNSPEGIILAEYQKGYMLREKVLRPALVLVNRHLQESQEATGIPSEDTSEGGDNP